MAIDLNLKGISLYIDNSIIISYFYSIYYIKLIGFLFLYYRSWYWFIILGEIKFPYILLSISAKYQ
jgi:hypothetical protein